MEYVESMEDIGHSGGWPRVVRATSDSGSRLAAKQLAGADRRGAGGSSALCYIT
jgi:hypothetical protein